MAKGKAPRKKKKKPELPKLSEDAQAQLEMLLNRVADQDPEGESFDQFLESLRPLLQRSLPFGLAFVRGLGSIASPSAVKTLQALREIPAPKPLRRAFKTALYRLGRQGLIQEDEKAEPEAKVLVPRPVDRQAEAWASWPESQGERGMILKLPDAGRGYLMVIGVLNPEGVFHEFEVIQTSRKGVKALLEQMTGGISGRIIDIPLAHFRFLYEEVAATYREQNLELPDGYEVIQRQLVSQVEAPPGPHIYDVLDQEEIAGDNLLLRSSDSLLEVQPFISWRLPEAVMAPFVEKIKELRETRLVISQVAQKERVEQIYREAATELFSAERRKHYRRLLEETALLFYLEGRQQEAKRALAVALDLKKEVGVFTENNFILGLVKRSLASEVGPHVEEAEEQAKRERTTESGLIIPR